MHSIPSPCSTRTLQEALDILILMAGTSTAAIYHDPQAPWGG